MFYLSFSLVWLGPHGRNKISIIGCIFCIGCSSVLVSCFIFEFDPRNFFVFFVVRELMLQKKVFGNSSFFRRLSVFVLKIDSFSRLDFAIGLVFRWGNTFRFFKVCTQCLFF